MGMKTAKRTIGSNVINGKNGSYINKGSITHVSRGAYHWGVWL